MLHLGKVQTTVCITKYSRPLILYHVIVVCITSGRVRFPVACFLNKLRSYSTYCFTSDVTLYPEYTNSRFYKLKEFADEKLNMTRKLKFIFEK